MISMKTRSGGGMRGSNEAGTSRTLIVSALLASLPLAAAGFGCGPDSSREGPAPAPPSQSQPAPAAAAQQPPPAKERVATDPAFPETPGQVAAPLRDFPQYRGATVVGSAEQARPREGAAPSAPPEGYRVKWTTSDSVPAVMEWYAKVLRDDKWTYQPEDSKSSAERQAHISKGTLDGYISAEATGNGTKIVLSLQDTRRATKKGQR